MELHIYRGSFNHLYDLGDEILKESKSSFEMGLLAESQTLDRPGLHGGQFTDKQCTKLLNNLDKLDQLSSSQDVPTMPKVYSINQLFSSSEGNVKKFPSS